MYFSAKVDDEKCMGCKICLVTCPDPNVISFIKSTKKAVVNPKRCKGCGLCAEVCPEIALVLGRAQDEAR